MNGEIFWKMEKQKPVEMVEKVWTIRKCSEDKASFDPDKNGYFSNFLSEPPAQFKYIWWWRDMNTLQVLQKSPKLT